MSFDEPITREMQKDIRAEEMGAADDTLAADRKRNAWFIGGLVALALVAGLLYSTGTDDSRNVASTSPAATTTGSGAAR